MKKTILILYSNSLSIGVFIPFLVNYLRPYFIVRFKNIKNLSKSSLNSYNCVLPTDVKSTSWYNSNITSKFFINNSSIYRELDDKYKSFTLARKLNIVKSIPTYNIKRKSDLIKFCKKYKSKRYIVKKNNGTNSFSQFVLDYSKIKNLKITNLKNYVIQPYFLNYQVYSIDLISVNGIIIGELYSKINKKNGVNFWDFFRGINAIILDNNDKFYSKIKSFSDKLIKHTKYSGILEIEFIVKNNLIYFLEINPRMCGHISQLDKGFNSAYFNNIIIPYINVYGISDIKKHNIISNITWGTNPYITAVYILNNYKYSLTIIILISVIAFISFRSKS